MSHPDVTAARPASVPTLTELVIRILREYEVFPGLALTESQLRRLCHADEARSTDVLAALVDIGFLRRTPEGCFVRDS